MRSSENTSSPSAASSLSCLPTSSLAPQKSQSNAHFELCLPCGRITQIVLIDAVPRYSFRALCTGSAGVNSIGIPLWYKGNLRSVLLSLDGRADRDFCMYRIAFAPRDRRVRPWSFACMLCGLLTLLLLPLDSFMVQGGDFTDRNGKGGESIYGPSFE
jgi:hypothetical protein